MFVELDVIFLRWLVALAEHYVLPVMACGGVRPDDKNVTFVRHKCLLVLEDGIEELV